jgi:flavin reductase (DIM6/NTAB) family NADH-FMN oxidoreductase RutF
MRHHAQETIAMAVVPNASSETRYDAFDLAPIGRSNRYKLLTGAVIPRPIAWVTSISPSGGVNLAPFSQFLVLTVDPALLAFSVGPGDTGRIKDTYANIETTREFVVNIVPEGAEELVQKSSEDVPRDVSEAELLDVTLIDSVKIAAPRLAMSPIQFECRLHQVVEIGDAPNHLVVGEVVLMHARQGLVTNYKIDLASYRPAARIGGRNYVRIGDVISL